MSSPSLSTLSAPEAFMMSMKPGCRGDPRMNRAVDAKLKNPNITLFDALTIGGFTYPRNVDAATIDNDRVTLGQRKNQLNRRLRLARQNLKSAAKGGNKSKGLGTSSPTRRKPISAGAKNPLVIANSYLRQRSRSKSTMKTAVTRVSPVQKEQPKPKQQQCPVSPSNNKVAPKGISLNTALISHAKQDLESVSVSPPVSDDVSSLSTLPTINKQGNATWPAANGFLVRSIKEPTPTERVNLVVADFAFGCIEQQQPQPQSFVENNDTTLRTVSTDTLVSAETSCNATSPSPATTGGYLAGTGIISKQELGQRIFQSGLQDLYKKSMMAAGFTPTEACESAPTFHQFAFEAWKNECERLQVVLQGQHAVEEQSGPNFS